MTPRVASPLRCPGSTYQQWRENGDHTSIETRAFWNWLTAPNQGVDAREFMVLEEQGVLSKGASGSGFLVPTDLAELIVSAARAQSALAQLALELPATTLALLTGHGDAGLWVRIPSSAFSQKPRYGGFFVP
jgi:hypothetical protein